MRTTGLRTVLLVVGSIALAALPARADVATYLLENVRLDSDDNNAQMFGTFTWTYDSGDFENGAGEFTYLEIPYTRHDHTDLDAIFDVTGSIEITLPGSVHDDGVDISLFLAEPLTPTTGSLLDLTRSRYEIGGNGFHDGFFSSGSIEFDGPTNVGESLDPVLSWIEAYPSPLSREATIQYLVYRPGAVTVAVQDASGRIVATLADGWHAAGLHATHWNAGSLGSGVYLLRYSSASGMKTRKVIVVR
ncbi:MAG: T9SS type A sorting domain-containing protein [Candidatus Eisenbacteria bacterium]